ncbi:hypothetical protein [Haliea sp.]|uniref:hypothetical protein n=1 Tax=Haliea sp. TaxID=1932666 RepID=UPI003527AD8D
MLRVLTLGVIAACLAGCGGQDEQAGKSAEDESVESARATVGKVLEATGLAVETEDGSLAMGFERDGESARIGQNLPIPEWLPKDFPLPQDLDIRIVTVDREEQRRLEGTSATVKQATASQQVSDWANRAGWEVISADDYRVTVVNTDGQVIDVQAEDGVGMQLDMSRRSVASDRQRAAVETVSPGTATITMADTTYTLNGECRIKGSSYGFEYTAADGSSYAQFTIQAAEDGPQGSATYQVVTGNGLTLYSINFPMYNGKEPVAQTSGKTFSVRGEFGSMGGGGIVPVPGSFAVSCE